MQSTTAYAIVTAKDGILTRTVGPTERSAMVNWLYTDALVAVGAHWTNELISKVFEIKAQEASVDVSPRLATVMINEI